MKLFNVLDKDSFNCPRVWSFEALKMSWWMGWDGVKTAYIRTDYVLLPYSVGDLIEEKERRAIYRILKITKIIRVEGPLYEFEVVEAESNEGVFDYRFK